MNEELSSYAARLRGLIANRQSAIGNRQFSELALELFALQFRSNPVYRKICEARHGTPDTVTNLAEIPLVPTASFKDLELSCIPPAERTAVFHSSGTEGQRPSRHFHCAESLALYETSLTKWFEFHFRSKSEFVFLTPAQDAAPRSSLVHMFETVRRNFNQPASAFTGTVSADGSWILDFQAILSKLAAACRAGKNVTLLGTAFSFVHLLDLMKEKGLRLQLPENSVVMETGGYKNRSRAMPKRELHELIVDRLGIAAENIVCEYGMSELSSQAYDSRFNVSPGSLGPRCFQFPPWARARIISPENGGEAADGETGLLCVYDLANTFSVAAIQTGDIGIRRGGHFELLGRAQLAEPRGCSLMTA